MGCRAFGSATGSNSRVRRIASTVYPAEIGSVASEIRAEPAQQELGHEQPGGVLS